MVNFNSLNKFVSKRRYSIIIFWTIFAIISMSLFAPNLIDGLTDDIPPPEDSEADYGSQLMTQYFPEKDENQGHIIILEDPDGEILGDDLKQFTQQLVSYVNQHLNEHLTRIGGYYVFDSTGLDNFKYQFISQDNSTSFISFHFNGDGDLQAEIAEDLRDYVDEIEPASLDVYSTGLAELRLDLKEHAESDIRRIDSIIIPMVFIALVILLRNWKYFPITLAPILMSIGITFGLLERYIAMTGVALQSFIPSLLFSITLGVGVDYNLFLLTRFREERLKGESVADSVKTMLNYSGHTVFTSGLTLTIALVGIAFFPFMAVAGVGIAISMSVAVLLLVNLTLTPALLLIFGNWVEKSPDQEKLPEKSEPKANNSDTKSASSHGLFYKIGKFSTKYNYWVILVILLLALPLSFQLLDTNAESQLAFFAPRDSESGNGFDVMQDNFGSGMVSPIEMIIAPNGGNVMDMDNYNRIQSFINRTISTTELDPRAFSSHTYLGGNVIPYGVAQSFITTSSPAYSTQEAYVYRQMGLQFVSNSSSDFANAAIVQIVLPIDPSSPDARDILHDLEEISTDHFEDDYKVGFTGQTAIDDSSIEKTYDLFPLIILVVIVSIYALIAIMFKAAVLPARLILSISLTVSFVYGAATVVFQSDTFLNSIIPALDEVSVIFWVVPVMTFSIIIGLGLDYGIFTIERIKENYWNGMPTNEAIAQGIGSTGNIITGAGIIMMITFGGLMFSSSWVLIQFGFILAFGVFLDTFVVRTLLVPAVLSLVEKLNWWPSKPPLRK